MMDAAADESRPMEGTNIGNFLKTFGYTGLVAACELPYFLTNQFANLIGFDDPLYYNKDGSQRHRPSLTQRFLYRRLAECHRRNSEYYQKKGKRDLADHAWVYYVALMDDVKGYNEAIKEHRLCICLW